MKANPMNMRTHERSARAPAPHSLPAEPTLASFEGVAFVPASRATSVSGRELGPTALAALNATLDFQSAKPFRALHSAHIAADPDDNDGCEQKCFVVVNLVGAAPLNSSRTQQAPEALLAQVAARLCARGPGMDIHDWECVDVDELEAPAPKPRRPRVC